MGMVDRQEHRSIGLGWDQRQSALQRAKHAALRIGIDRE